MAIVAYFRIKDFNKKEENASAPLIYDVIEDNNNYYDEEKKVYFIFVIIRNYKDDVISNTKLDYSFEILNKENSPGIFKVVNTTTNEETEYKDSVTVNGELKANEKQDIRYKIYINSSNTDSTVNQRISYEIKYNFSRK